MARNKAPSAAVWSREVEQRSLQHDPALLREARANTRALRHDPSFLHTLARELAIARGPELTRNYRSLVWVMPGFRTRRGARGQRTLKELCVVFVVRRKRELSSQATQCLPAWLLTFAEHDGVRKPFALPTDVQEASDYRAAQAHGDSGVWVQRPGWATRPGHFVSFIALDAGGARQICLLSAQHVFSPFADGDALQVQGGLNVMPLDAQGGKAGAPRLALSVAAGGVLRADQRPDRPSFDVQLAAVDPAGMALLRQHAPLKKFNAQLPWLRSPSELLQANQHGPFHLLTPDNHGTQPHRGALPMALLSLPTSPVGFEYELQSGGQLTRRQVFHAELIAFKATGVAKPLGGDSGSPIVVRHSDGSMTLAAMHIGGDGQGLSWAIPAWRLLDLRQWLQFPAGASIVPMNV